MEDDNITKEMQSVIARFLKPKINTPKGKLMG